MIQEDDVLSRATEPPFLSALHAKNNTTNPFGYKLGELTENNKALLFFSGKETVQIDLSSVSPPSRYKSYHGGSILYGGSATALEQSSPKH